MCERIRGGGEMREPKAARRGPEKNPKINLDRTFDSFAREKMGWRQKLARAEIFSEKILIGLFSFVGLIGGPISLICVKRERVRTWE